MKVALHSTLNYRRRNDWQRLLNVIRKERRRNVLVKRRRNRKREKLYKLNLLPLLQVCKRIKLKRKLSLVPHLFLAKTLKSFQLYYHLKQKRFSLK